MSRTKWWKEGPISQKEKERVREKSSIRYGIRYGTVDTVYFFPVFILTSRSNWWNNKSYMIHMCAACLLPLSNCKGDHSTLFNSHYLSFSSFCFFTVWNEELNNNNNRDDVDLTCLDLLLAFFLSNLIPEKLVSLSVESTMWERERDNENEIT